MSSVFGTAGALLALILALGCLWARRELIGSRKGRLVLGLGVVLLPLTISGGGVAVGVQRSSETAFCVSCHSMEAYGKSLFVDGGDSLAAAHYQQRLVPRETACFVCHTNYAMFGDVKAKMNGLLHVWVHYTGQTPDNIELYEPYPNHNCLYCHDDARGFLEIAEHREQASALRRDERSCLFCHDVAHDREGVLEGRFWSPEAL